jgi:hypothetical protein
MVIANTGNVGIGTTAPNAYSKKKTLEINATWGGVIENSVSGTVKSRWDWSTGGITQFGTYVNEPLHLITNSSMAVTILGDGNVGIGATPGTYKLYVNGTTKSGSSYPLTDNAHELGNTSLRWASLTAVAVTGVSGTFSGALNVSGTSTLTGQLTLQNDDATLRVRSNTTTTKGVTLRYNHAGSFGELRSDQAGVNQLDMKYYALTHKFGRNDSLQYLTIDSAGAATFSGALAIGSASAVPWKLYVNGITKINGALEVNGQFSPSANDTYNLGNSTNSWKNLYISDSISCATFSSSGASSVGGTLSGAAATFSGLLSCNNDAVFQKNSHTVVSIKAQASGDKYAMLYMTSNGTQDNYIRADVGDLVIDGSHTSVNITKALAVTGTLTVSGGIKDKNNSTGSASHVLHSDGLNRVYWTTAPSATIPGSVTNKYYTYIQLTTAAGDYYTITHSLGETDVNVTVRRAISGTGSRADRFNADAGRHFDVGAEVQVISCDANGAHSSNHISLWFDTYTVVNNEYVYVTVIG